MRIGIIGFGKIAEKHINAYKKLGGIDLIINDKDRSKKQLANRHGIEWRDKQSDLIRDDTVGAIDVCVPTPHHYEVIDYALECGKHVFCEKPLTLSLGEARAIKKKAQRLSKIVAIGYLYRFHPGFQLIKKILDEGIIGDPYYAIFRLGGRGSHSLWKHRKAKGGGVVNEMFVHMCDLMMWYFGELRKIDVLQKEVLLKRRRIDGKVNLVDADDMILLNLNNKNVNITCQCDLVSPSYMNYVEIHGSNGSTWTSILDFFPTIVYCNEPHGIYDRGHNFFNFPKVDLFYEELKSFIDTIQKNMNGTDSIDQSIDMLKLIKQASL